MSTTDPYYSKFEAMYREYMPAVLQICTGYMKGDRSIAKDLAQEVFVNVWNALPKFRGDSSPKTWIYRITVNTCLLHIRSEKKKNETSLPDQMTEHLASEAGNEEAISELYTAIGKLQELDRLIIMMVLEEVEYEDIAGITGISPDTLRVKIHRIKKRLRKLMETPAHHG